MGHPGNKRYQLPRGACRKNSRSLAAPRNGCTICSRNFPATLRPTIPHSLRRWPSQAKIIVSFTSEVQQLLSHRGRLVLDFVVAQARDSMYGRMTFATRQTFAAFQSSSMLAFLRLRVSRRASSATSRPSLFLYLKQSATVFAGLNTWINTFSIFLIWTPYLRGSPEKRTIRRGG